LPILKTQQTKQLLRPNVSRLLNNPLTITTVYGPPSVQAQWLLPLRCYILAWMITWVMAIPLFHIHLPDTTDGWSALQSGGAHTVFTPDLPGEFSQPFQDSHHSRHLSQRVVSSPELGMAVSLDEPEHRKAKGSSGFTVQYLFPRESVLINTALVMAEATLKGQLPRAFSASRAPPHTARFS
jgi:hypothetical protein